MKLWLIAYYIYDNVYHKKGHDTIEYDMIQYNMFQFDTILYLSLIHI